MGRNISENNVQMINMPDTEAKASRPQNQSSNSERVLLGARITLARLLRQ